jgi:hypothetical protein
MPPAHTKLDLFFIPTTRTSFKATWSTGQSATERHIDFTEPKSHSAYSRRSATDANPCNRDALLDVYPLIPCQSALPTQMRKAVQVAGRPIELPLLSVNFEDLPRTTASTSAAGSRTPRLTPNPLHESSQSCQLNLFTRTFPTANSKT